MIREKDIKAIYEGFYKITKLVGDDDYTFTINRQLHLLLTNRIAPTTNDTEDTLRALWELSKTIHPLSEEYYSKFDDLRKKQLEARTQK